MNIVDRLNKVVIWYMTVTKGKKPKAIRLSEKYYDEYLNYLSKINRLFVRQDCQDKDYLVLHFQNILLLRGYDAQI